MAVKVNRINLKASFIQANSNIILNQVGNFFYLYTRI